MMLVGWRTLVQERAPHHTHAHTTHPAGPPLARAGSLARPAPGQAMQTEPQTSEPGLGGGRQACPSPSPSGDVGPCNVVDIVTVIPAWDHPFILALGPRARSSSHEGHAVLRC